MARKKIEEIFPTKTQSVWEFMRTNGQGCYIPAYQRPYSWDIKNISRLFEEILQGIHQITSCPDTTSFIGAVIAIHDTKYQTVKPIYHGKLPSRVMTIIDGQQRICTILMSNIVIHDYIRRIIKQFEGKTETHLAWICEKCDALLVDLRNTYLIDQADTDDNYRYYPRVIRAYSDAWSDRQDEAIYESPMAKLIWKYIDFTESETSFQFKLDLGDNNRYKTVSKIFDFIQKEVTRICQSHSDEYNFPDLQESFTGIRDFPLPYEVKKHVAEASNDQDHRHFCYLLRLLILARYLNHRIAITVVETKNENDAFDMFEALNTTGELLTAFETFKPKVIEREKLSEYEGTESYRWMTKIEEYLNRYTNANKRQQVTADMLVHFALFETGGKLQKTLRDQRRYLHDEFDKWSKRNNIEENRSFVRSLARVASFLESMWDVEKGQTPDFASLNIDNEEALVGFEFLRGFKHSITVAPLARFYQKILDAEQEADRIKKTEDFVAAIKATVAFSALWRGAKGGTQNIDSYYRDIMRSGVHFDNESVPPLARCPNDKSGVVSIVNYKKALQLVLQDKGKIENKEDWVEKVSTTAIYKHSTVLTRFLVFCASDNAIPDEVEKGLVKKGLPGVGPLLMLNQWKNEAYLTVEHVAPQSRKNGWEKSIYESIYSDSKTVHTLGNLILLPKEVNEIIGNRSWEHKKLMYSLLSAQTEEEFEDRQKDLAAVGLNLSKKASEVIENAEYLGLCKSVALYDKDWALDIIEKRTRRFAELAWDRLAEWLF